MYLIIHLLLYVTKFYRRYYKLEELIFKIACQSNNKSKNFIEI